MKRFCKGFNILDIDFLEFCAQDCLRKKWKREDVKEYFCKISDYTPNEIEYKIKNGEREGLIKIAAKHMQEELSCRKLNLVPIWYKKKIDKSNCKEREIGIQNISQQLYDYMAVYSMTDFLRRIGDYQCASIPGKGTWYAASHIYNWLRENDSKYVAQLDVQKCFPSIPHDKLLAFIDKYIANDDIKWPVHELVGTFKEGLSIGSYLSQYLCNLYMSQLYHKISEDMYYNRRGKRVNYVNHVLIYMDDILIIGGNSKSIHKAVKEIIRYANKEMGLTIKPDWKVKEINDNTFVDIVGVRIYRDHTTIRKRTFLRLRRAYKKIVGKKNMPVDQAQRCISYYGYIKNTNSERLSRRFRIAKSVKIAKGVISRESKFRHRTKPG